MSITVSFYTESTPIDFNEPSSNSFDSFKSKVFDSCSFIKDTSNIKFYYITESSRVFIEDDSSLKKFFNSSAKTIYAIDEQYEKNLIENSPEDVKQFVQEIDSIEQSKADEIRQINQNFEDEIRNISHNLTEVMNQLFNKHVNEQLSSLIKITPNNPTDETNIHLLNKQCSICGLNPLTGSIYECESCSNYVLCHQCFERFKAQHFGHYKEHNFYKVVYDNALYKMGKKEEGKTSMDYINAELVKIKSQPKDYKVETANNATTIYWNYLEIEEKRKEKIKVEYTNIGNKTITGNILNSPFGSEQYKVYKIDTDFSVNNTKKGEKIIIEFNPPASFANKQVGTYYVPVGVSKNKAYVDGSVVVFAIKIIIEGPDYQVFKIE